MEFVSRYASALNPNDVMQLFDLLVNALGSHAAAADACDLTRKTTYDWKTVKDLKFDSKIKLLNALMEKIPEETLDYLTDRSVSYTSDILMTHLSAIYESIMDITERESIDNKLKLFNKIRNQYAGLIVGKFDAEVDSKIFYLKQKAKTLHLDWMPNPSPMMTTDQACIIIPMIISEIISKRDMDDKKISYDLNVSEELVKSIRSSLQRTLTLSGVIPTDFRRQLEYMNRTITSIIDPSPITSPMLESSSIIKVTTDEQESMQVKCG